MQVKLNFFRGTSGKSARRRQEVPQDPDVKLQEIYDKVLRMVPRRGDSELVRETQEIITAMVREAFGPGLPDAYRLSPEVHRRVAEEIAAGRRVVVTGGQLRFDKDRYV
jgi:hypothetical protein